MLKHFNIDPVLWGVLVFVNLQGSVPVGRRWRMSAFYLKGVSPPHVTLNQIFAGMMPYMLIVILCMVFMYLWPGMTLWLPAYCTAIDGDRESKGTRLADVPSRTPCFWFTDPRSQRSRPYTGGAASLASTQARPGAPPEQPRHPRSCSSPRARHVGPTRWSRTATWFVGSGFCQQLVNPRKRYRGFDRDGRPGRAEEPDGKINRVAVNDGLLIRVLE